MKGSVLQFNRASEPHSTTMAVVVGSKVVYVRPSCSEFLKELEKIAVISLWSSMKKSTMDEVRAYLFWEGSLPFVVLGQDSCKTVKYRDRFGRMATYKEPGTNKELFLKNLDVLTACFQGCLSSDNTIIVDDSPRKHMMNSLENVILTDCWSNQGNGDKDTFLLSNIR